jgi:hypothetical protein
MKSILLHTAHRRFTEAGLLFADAGETLSVGTEISAQDAAALIERGGAVDPDAVSPVPEAAVEAPAKAKPGK